MTTRESLALTLALAVGIPLAPALLHGAVWVLAVYAAALGGL